MEHQAGPSFEVCPGRRVGEGHPVFVVAEIGQNHQGDLEIAKKMIAKAKEAGAEAVKFQKSVLEEMFTRTRLDKSYSSKNSFGDTYGQHKRNLEFTEDQYRELQHFANEVVGIPFTASGMDAASLRFLAFDLGVPFVKIASLDSNNLPTFEALAKGNLVPADVPIIISTGMADMDAVRTIYKQMKQRDGGKFALLQCTSSYPAPDVDVNLNVIDAYRAQFPDVVTGYSGHEIGYVPTLGAVAKGAKIVERHFTLDRGLKGSDHACSLDLASFAEMVAAIRRMEAALGSGDKMFQESEVPCFRKLGKTLVAARQLQKRDVLVKGDLAVKVAEVQGVDPMDYHSVVGKSLLSDLSPDDIITDDSLQEKSQQVT